MRIQTDAPRDPTPPRPRLPAPPPPPAGGPPSLQAGVPQAKINSWRGVAAALNRDLGSDAAMKACAWPCLKTFLLGGAPCTTGCGKCAKGAGRGDDAARARARNKLADLESRVRVQLGGELAPRARLDAAAADLADDVLVEAPQLAREATEGATVDLPPAREGRVDVARLHRPAILGVARVPDVAARERHEGRLREARRGLVDPTAGALHPPLEALPLGGLPQVADAHAPPAERTTKLVEARRRAGL